MYAGTPGAGNSPRIIIPSLPPLAILAAGGLEKLALRWRLRLQLYLLGLFVATSVLITVYQYQKGRELDGDRAALRWLHDQPRGLVLAEHFWTTILYARQPATWFEFDEVFERNIMRDAANFERYVTQNKIRYVILPPGDQLAAPAVRSLLEQQAQPHLLGTLTVYQLY